MYNLTDRQKEIAMWLVQNIRAGNLNENFKVFWVPNIEKATPEAGFTDYKGSVEELANLDLTQGSLIALSNNNLLFYQVKESEQFETWDCTLTGEIYKAVDNDFNSPDISFMDYLTPLANPSGFDKELVQLG
jgi:hypothetical protein